MAGSQAEARRLLCEVAAEYQEILKENLVGIYEHGSLAFGCFRWEVSDIDFLTVVKRKLTQTEKEKLIGVLMKRRGQAPEKGFEMSVVLEEDVRPFKHPTPFELHYSEAHYAAVQADLSAYCARMNGTDRDLAAHCTVIQAKGQTVVGRSIAETFSEVPWTDYLDSIRYDVEQAEEDILENPVYVILNLCRVLAAAREGLILSKQEGGMWGERSLDAGWQELIRGALNAYISGVELKTDAAQAKEFAGYMMGLLNKTKNRLNSM